MALTDYPAPPPTTPVGLTATFMHSHHVSKSEVLQVNEWLSRRGFDPDAVLAIATTLPDYDDPHAHVLGLVTCVGSTSGQVFLARAWCEWSRRVTLAPEAAHDLDRIVHQLARRRLDFIRLTLNNERHIEVTREEVRP